MYEPRKIDVNKYVLRCSVGCLRHVVGVTVFEHSGEGWDTDEPEMSFETLHEPYEGFWKRLYRAWRFVVFREPIGVDSSLIGVEDAQKLIQACEDYMTQYEKWVKRPKTY
jgi:hypothetical protein